MVGFAGSRVLPSVAAPGGLVARVVASLPAGCSVSVGCSVGADAACLRAALVRGLPVSVFSAFGPSGRGSFRGSARALVLGAAASGRASVSWWAGGRGSLRSRLVARTRAFASSLGPGSVLVAFFAGPSPSRGSSLACRVALSSGASVFAFPVSGGVAALPSLGRGRWVAACSSGVWALGFRWVPASSGG